MKLKFLTPPTSLDDWVQFIAVMIMRTLLLVAMVLTVVSGQWLLFVPATLAYVFSFIPNLLERHYRVDFPIEFELIAILFIFSSIFLGFFMSYYDRVWWWDDLLHTSSGVVLGFGSFLFLYTLHYQKKLMSTPFIIAFLSFCFALAMGAVWEILEFITDFVFGSDAQRSLDDTMWDLIVASLGALVIVIPGYFYIKHDKPSMLARFLKKYVAANPHLKPKIPDDRS